MGFPKVMHESLGTFQESGPLAEHCHVDVGPIDAAFSCLAGPMPLLRYAKARRLQLSAAAKLKSLLRMCWQFKTWDYGLLDA